METILPVILPLVDSLLTTRESGNEDVSQPPVDDKIARQKLEKSEQEKKDPIQIPEKLDNVAELLNASLVNSQWYTFSTEILKSREDFYISISTAEKSQEFASIVRHQYSADLDSALTVFQCKNFKFDAKLPSESLFQDFSRSHAGNIKRLVFTNLIIDYDSSQDVYMRAFYSFLFHKIPQVEYLEIQCEDCQICTTATTDFSDCWKDKELEQVQLEKLKVFQFFRPSWLRPHFSEFIKGIIVAAKNLQELNVPLSISQDTEVISKLVGEGRSHIIKEIEINMSFERNVDVLEQFADSNPKVRVIHTILFSDIWTHRHLWLRFENCFNKIFSSSESTIESVSLNPMGFLEGFRIPQKMKALNELCINVSDYNHVAPWNERRRVETRLFPPSSLAHNFLQETFLNLTKVMISWENYLRKNHSWESTFSDCAFTMKSVIHLSLHRVSSGGNWLEKISKSFPNVKTLVVEGLHFSDNLINFLRRIYPSFPNVETLVINRIVDRYLTSMAYMDSCVTGIPENKCRELGHRLNQPKKEYPGPVTYLEILEMESYRQYPSLLNMKCLKSLILRPGRCMLKYFRDKYTESGKLELFSPAANIYAFDLIPEFKVIIQVD